MLEFTELINDTLSLSKFTACSGCKAAYLQTKSANMNILAVYFVAYQKGRIFLSRQVHDAHNDMLHLKEIMIAGPTMILNKRNGG
jgi:hypothetical protein